MMYNLSVSDTPYQEALQKAQEELAQLELRRATLLKVIENLKSLAREEMWELTPPPDYEPEGMTAEIRKILGLTMAHLNAVQIRDALIQRGFSADKPKNLLIAVHTVLGRIKDEFDVIERVGNPAYKVKSTTFSTMAQLFGGFDEEKMRAVAKAYEQQMARIGEQMAIAAKAYTEQFKPLTHNFRPTPTMDATPTKKK